MSADFVTVLECEPGRRLAKQIHADGTVDDYDGGWLYRPEAFPVESLAELGTLLEALAGDPTTCIIRGALRPGALAEWVPRRSKDKEDREAPDFESAAHRWVCLDLDASVQNLDPSDPRASVAAWRATLPAPLNSCGMVFKLSAKASLFPYLRGHAWIWASSPVGDVALRAWCAAHDFDPALARAVQPHYTADPVFVEGTDPYKERRIHIFEGPDANIDWAAVPAPVGRPEITDRPGAPDAPADAEVLAVLGDARDHQGRRWHLCGALGGVWRRQWRSKEWARATITEWLSTVPGDHSAAVEWCLGAWGMAPERCTGAAELVMLLDGDAAWAERVARASMPAHRRGTDTGPSMAPAVSDLVGDIESPILLSGARSQMYVRTETGYAGPYHEDQMPVVLRALGMEDVCGRGADGKLLRPAAVYASGAHIEKVIRAFSDARTWYDAETAELHHGYELPDVAPVEDPAVAGWLAALCGDMLPNVLEWIASCSQVYIDQKAAALVLIGPPGIGKTKIFEALAALWGARSFVPLADSVAQFNGTITRCPIVVDDECAALKARKVTSAEFRQRVQASVRDYELKGKERVELVGCTREGITANDRAEVTFADVRGGSVVDALRDRLLVVECLRPGPARAALAAVRGAGDDAAELARIAGHLAWVWATVTPVAARFIGAGGHASEAVALSGAAEEGAELWDSLARFLEDIPDEAATPPLAGWIVWRGALWGNPAMLAQVLALKDRRWTARTVSRLLAVVGTGWDRIRVEGGSRPRYYKVDLDRAMAIVTAQTA